MYANTMASESSLALIEIENEDTILNIKHLA